MKKLLFLAILGLASSEFYAKTFNSVNKLNLSLSKKVLPVDECNLYRVELEDGIYGRIMLLMPEMKL